MKKFIAILFITFINVNAFAYFNSKTLSNNYHWGLTTSEDELTLVSTSNEDHFIFKVDKKFGLGDKMSDSVLLTCGNLKYLVTAGSSQRCDSPVGAGSSIRILAENFKNGSSGEVLRLKA